MRGYFGIGVEGVSKAMNLGNLFRSAYAFGASFVFTIAAACDPRSAPSDTARSALNVPYYPFASPAALALPHGCRLVGIELMGEAEELPVFRHPRAAAYVLGPERGSLSPELVRRCHHLVRIPTRFSINLGVAGAIVMYDRLLNLGRYPHRPVSELGSFEALAPHVQGGRIVRRRKTA